MKKLFATLVASAVLLVGAPTASAAVIWDWGNPAITCNWQRDPYGWHWSPYYARWFTYQGHVVHNGRYYRQFLTNVDPANKNPYTLFTVAFYCG